MLEGGDSGSEDYTSGFGRTKGSMSYKGGVQRREAASQEKAVRTESIKASRAVAASYIFRPSKMPRTSAIGMRNNSTTLG